MELRVWIFKMPLQQEAEMANESIWNSLKREYGDTQVPFFLKSALKALVLTGGQNYNI